MCVKSDLIQCDMPEFTDAWSQLFLKAGRILTAFLETAELQEVCFCVASRPSGSCTRQLSCILSCLWKLHEYGELFWMVFRGCRRASFKAVSRTKTTCNLEQSWVGCRGLSTKREQCLKVSSDGRFWGVLGYGNNWMVQGRLFEWQK